jgi:hypothetical protein
VEHAVFGRPLGVLHGGTAFLFRKYKRLKVRIRTRLNLHRDSLPRAKLARSNVAS